MATSITLTITQIITSASGALLEGDHAGALALLQSALTYAKAGLEGHQITEISQEVRTGANFQLYALPLELDECHDSFRDTCPCSLFTFYNAAIISDEMCGPQELAFASELSATILYNLGLVYHRIALLTGSTAYFSKALKLYEVSASIVLAPGTETNFQNDMTILKLAVCVNMGHIYSSFCDQTGTTRCANLVQEIFRVLNPDTLTSEMRKIFNKNLFITQNQHLMSLAPAA